MLLLANPPEWFEHCHWLGCPPGPTILAGDIDLQREEEGELIYRYSLLLIWLGQLRWCFAFGWWAMCNTKMSRDIHQLESAYGEEKKIK